MNEERSDSGTVICPYCQCEMQYNGDPRGQGEEFEWDCDVCEQTFKVEVEVKVEHVSKEIRT